MKLPRLWLWAFASQAMAFTPFPASNALYLMWHGWGWTELGVRHCASWACSLSLSLRVPICETKVVQGVKQNQPFIEHRC